MPRREGDVFLLGTAISKVLAGFCLEASPEADGPALAARADMPIRPRL
jgi:hypothetical protein